MTSKTTTIYPPYVMESCRKARGLSEDDPSQDHEIMAQSKRSAFWATVEGFNWAPTARLIFQFLEDVGADIRWPDEGVDVTEVMKNFP